MSYVDEQTTVKLQMHHFRVLYIEMQSLPLRNLFRFYFVGEIKIRDTSLLQFRVSEQCGIMVLARKIFPSENFSNLIRFIYPLFH